MVLKTEPFNIDRCNTKRKKKLRFSIFFSMGFDRKLNIVGS